MIRRESVSSLRGTQAWIYIGVPITLIVALGQVVLVKEIPVIGIKPNVFLLFVVTWVLLGGFEQGLLLGILGGLLLEANSGATVGCILLGLVAAAGFAGLSEINVFRGAWFLKYLAILGATLLYEVVYLTFSVIAGPYVLWGFAFRHVIIPEMLVHLALMPLSYGVLAWVSSHFRDRLLES